MAKPEQKHEEKKDEGLAHRVKQLEADVAALKAAAVQGQAFAAKEFG